MNKIFILGLFAIMLVFGFTTAFAYSNDELTKRLISCTPSKNLNAGGSITYQITGLMGPVCVFRIQNADYKNKPDLICKVPKEKMRDIISCNPFAFQGIKKQYCVISLKHVNY